MNLRPLSPNWNRRGRDLMMALALALTAALVWAWTYDRLTPAAWQAPLFYGGDTSLVMSFAESAAEGGFQPGGFKTATRLGAPFGADWNSWPITEEFLYWTTGVLSRWIGFPAATAFIVMLGHALAAAAFFLACRALGKPRLPSAVFALGFGLSYFIFLRGLGHVILAYAWQVPLGWLVACYAFSERGLMKNPRRLWTGVAVGVVTGLQNPYYTFILVQFLGLAALAQLFRPRRSWRTVGGPLIVAGVACAAFAAMQADTLLDRWVHHRGALSVHRSYTDVELFALKPMDLLVPLHWKLPFFASRAQTYVHDRIVPAEYPMAFLGVIGAVGALVLAALVFRDLATRRGGRFSPATRNYAAPAAWIVAVGCVGGVLGMGSLLTGVSFLRGADRFSVVILTLVLMFLTDGFSRLTRGWPLAGKLALAALPLLGFAVDLPARRPAEVDADHGEEWRNYGEFVGVMEREVGRGGMVFNLPVSDFPEAVPRQREDPYAPLLLYLTRPESGLRFSYGNMAGDYRDAWQQRCAGLPAPAMVAELRRLGFGGVVVSRAAYADGGEALLNGLAAAAGRPVMPSTAGEFGFVPLGLVGPTPAAVPETANLSLQQGWWGTEFDAAGEPHVWTKGAATLALFLDPGRGNSASEAPPTVSFEVSSPVDRELRLSCRGKTLAVFSLLANRPQTVESLPLDLRPGWNQLHFGTSQPPSRRKDLPGDTREVALFVGGLRATGLSAKGAPPPRMGRLALASGIQLTDADRNALAGTSQIVVTDAGSEQRRWIEFLAAAPSASGGVTRGLEGEPVRRIEFLPSGEPFRVVVRLTPEAGAVDHATVMSCLIPGARGLILGREPGAEQRYHAAIGDGQGFKPVGGAVQLSPGQRYVLAVTVTGDEVTLQFRGTDGLDETLRYRGPECEDLRRFTWQWGDWYAGGRAFTGRIELLSLGVPSDPSVGVPLEALGPGGRDGLPPAPTPAHAVH